MNNAKLIVTILKQAGVERGFGVPSGNVLPLMEAMRVGGIDFVLTAHEGSAGFAADVTSRMARTPGLCIATLGPGATNLATGIGCAYLDRSPLIAITCNLHQAQLGRRIQMWIDHQTLFKPITKASLVLRPGNIAATVVEALRLAMAEPQGPVHLDLPEDVALAEATESASAPFVLRLSKDEQPAVHPFDRGTQCLAQDTASTAATAAQHERFGRPQPDSLDKAAALLRRAQRPIAVIGASAMRMQRPELLLEFVERHRIPFASTTMAKGLIDESHPLSLGCIERACRQLQRRFIQDRADLIIGLGYDTIEVEYEAWTANVPVLHVDIEKADVDSSVTLAHELIGDLDASVSALAALEGIETAWDEERRVGEQSVTHRLSAVEQHRDAFHRALRPATEHFAPHQAIDVVRRALPREGVLAFDVGAHTHQIASQWTAHAPRTFLITNGWSSMGFGLPAAIAAKLARPDLPVVCIVGDGCFQMTCGELAVARREKLAIPFVVLDDRWLSLIKVKQERRSLEHYGTELFEDDYEAPPAHYFGVPAVGVRTPDELERELAKALQAPGPTVIEALVDPAHYSDTVYD